MTVAIGPSISRLGAPLPNAGCSRPNPATVVVIRVASSRSDAPRRTASVTEFLAIAEPIAAIA
jgi:hypothetical protein